jgi:arsenite methyltransferase
MELTPENQESIAKYAKRAAHYDATCGPTQPIRLKTIDYLQLTPGNTVLDVGCGTGLSFGPLLDRVGAAGHVLAFEQSPEMFAQAKARIAGQGWHNVHLLHTNAEHYRLPPDLPAPNAVLMHYVHDITRTEAAVSNLFEQLPSGTRVGLAGMKNFSGALRLLNWLAYIKNAAYNALAHDMETPWDKVQRYVPNLVVEPTQWGMGYVAHGRRA